MGCRSWWFTLLFLLAISGYAGADEPQTRAPQPSSSPDFWFGRPRGSLGIQGGWLFARAQSDLFDFVQQNLTVERKDMNAPAVIFSGGVAAGPRVDVLAGFEFSRSGKTSEYRHFVDNNRLPISQVTHLRQMNLSGSLRFALLPSGRSVSRLVWIPRTVTPYVGAGAGILWYKFEQDGDFIDVADLSVFNDTLTSRGWGPSAHIFGGVEVNVWRRMYLTTEARYLWSHADISGDFSGFQPIDLTGAKVTLGVRYAF